jgi:hypothetical protein
MFGGRCSFTSPYLFGYAGAAQRAIHLGRPVLHAFVRFSVAKLASHKLQDDGARPHEADSKFRLQAPERLSGRLQYVRPLFPHFAALQEAVGLMVNDSAFCRGRRTSIADEMREEHRRRASCWVPNLTMR